MRLLSVSLAISIYCMLPLPPILAQSVGTIHGLVQDETGAAVPGVSVTAIQMGTNLTRMVSTGENGLYLLSSLPVGNYAVRFTKSGFADFLQREVILQVN